MSTISQINNNYDSDNNKLLLSNYRPLKKRPLNQKVMLQKEKTTFFLDDAFVEIEKNRTGLYAMRVSKNIQMSSNRLFHYCINSTQSSINSSCFTRRDIFDFFMYFDIPSGKFREYG